MTAVQDHGLVLERFLGRAHLGFEMPAVSHVSPFDIDAGVADDGLPVSFKVAKAGRSGATIGMGDARRTWEHAANTPFRLVCATYRQSGGYKVFFEVHESLITPAAAKTLLGDVSLRDVRLFHESLLAFGAGQHAEARAHAKIVNSGLREKRGILGLNPKIDSKSQRRLQCSVRMSDLMAAVPFKTHDRDYKGMELPFCLVSKSRVFKERIDSASNATENVEKASG